jgi:serine protease DegQ
VPGVVIRGVVRNGPADRAGIRARDVVLEIDGKPTRDTPALLARIAEIAPGSATKVKLWRAGIAADVEVTAGKRPAAER